jgi:hypothetical protein
MPPPPPVYLPTIIETIIPVLAPLALPFLLLFPSPTAPRELDEAPLRPPPRPPREPNIPDYFIDPPNWDDLIRDPFDPGIDFTPGVRLFPFPLEDDFVQAKPISDLPDLVGVIPDLEIPLFGPIEVPDYDYIANPTRSPEPGRRTAPVGDPRSVPNPFSDPFGWPLPFGVPGTDPFSPTAPEVFPEPRTIADPVTGPGSPIGEPVRIGDPIEGSPTPGLDPFPLTAFAPDFAQPDVDTCQCEGGGKKKKKRKKKPREVCYRGTYIETSRSLKKTRKEEVPCQ